jgi:PAS domain S-box-containing protein
MNYVTNLKSKRWWVEPGVTAGFLIAWLLLSIVGIVAFWSALRYSETSRAVVQTRDVLTSLEETISLLKDAETGQRGFLLTGTPNFLEPYELAQRELPSSLARLRNLTDQQSRLAELESLSRAKLDDLVETIRLAQAGDNQAALDRVRSGRGKQIMDDARAVVQQMQQTEETRLRQRETEANNASRLVQLTIPLGFTLAAIMLVLTGWQLNGDVRRRRLAEENLRELNVRLDEQVKERTAQLEEALEAEKQLRAEYQQTVAQLDSLLASAPFGLSIMDKDLRYLRVNRAIAEIDGREITEYTNRTVAELVPHLADQLIPIIQKVWETGEPSPNLEINGYTAAQPDKLRHWLVSYYLVKNAAAQKYGVGVIILEITERKNAEEAVRRSAERLSRLQQITGAFAAALSPRQIADILLNEAMSTMQAQDGVVYLMEPDGQTLGLISTGAASHPVVQRLKQISLGSPMAISHVAGTGEPYWIEKLEDYGEFEATRQILEEIGSRSAFILPLTIQNKTIGVFRLSFTQYREFGPEERDFALALAGQAAQALERARLYAELEERAAELEVRVYERTRQLERANRYKTDFLSQMSHELRTPLNSIIGFTAIIRRGLAGPLTPEQQKQLDMVQGSAQQLLALISGLLDLSRIEAGRVSVEYSRFGLNDLIRQAVESMRPLAEGKSLELRLALDERLAELQIRSDALKLKQILLNLLSNAVKYTDAGHIVLRAEPINGLPQNVGELFTVRICVEDSGIGIAAHRLPQLFEAFGQLEEAGNRRSGGSGLGLALTQRLVELLKGRVEVKSQPEQGTTFIIYLPLERA